MTMVAEKASQSVVDLCKAVKGKSTPIEDLAAVLQKPEVLGEALSLGLVEIGRQHYTLCMLAPPTQKMTRDEKGKQVPLRDEAGHFVMDKVYEVRLDGDWSWLKSNTVNRQSIAEIITEKPEHKDVPPLHVKITNAGLAACRQ